MWPYLEQVPTGSGEHLLDGDIYLHAVLVQAMTQICDVDGVLDKGVVNELITQATEDLINQVGPRVESLREFAPHMADF